MKHAMKGAGALLLMLLSPLVDTQLAHAETEGQYHLSTSARVCIEDHGWTRWNDVLPNVAWRLRADGVTDAVVWDDCSSQPAGQTVTLQAVNEPTLYFCARTLRGRYFSDGTAADRTVIQVNMAAVWFDQCHKTWSQRAHVMSHEMGHALGLIHNADLVSVMYAGASNPWLLWFGEPDYAGLHRIYG